MCFSWPRWLSWRVNAPQAGRPSKINKTAKKPGNPKLPQELLSTYEATKRYIHAAGGLDSSYAKIEDAIAAIDAILDSAMSLKEGKSWEWPACGGNPSKTRRCITHQILGELLSDNKIELPAVPAAYISSKPALPPAQDSKVSRLSASRPSAPGSPPSPKAPKPSPRHAKSAVRSPQRRHPARPPPTPKTGRVNSLSAEGKVKVKHRSSSRVSSSPPVQAFNPNPYSLHAFKSSPVRSLDPNAYGFTMVVRNTVVLSINRHVEVMPFFELAGITGARKTPLFGRVRAGEFGELRAKSQPSASLPLWGAESLAVDLNIYHLLRPLFVISKQPNDAFIDKIQWVCGACNNQFLNHSTLTQHMQAKHYAQEPTLCICGLGFVAHTLRLDHCKNCTQMKLLDTILPRFFP